MLPVMKSTSSTPCSCLSPCISRLQSRKGALCLPIFHYVIPQQGCSVSIRIACDISRPSLASSVGSLPLSTISAINFSQKHTLVLSIIACTSASAASCLFFSAIPALLALKKASESLEELFEAMRAELPDTMAAIRLSGMEISDLTMELSDMGHGITQGVRNSTRSIRMAHDRLRRLSNVTSGGGNFKAEKVDGESRDG